MKRFILITVIISVLLGCKEIYYPEVSERNEKLLIVEGFLSATKDMVEVTLNYTTNNDIKGLKNPVCCAEIFVTDQNGHRTYLQNYSNGTYTTPLNVMVIEPGDTYKLYIQLEDGTEFESGEETVPDLPSEISILSDPGENIILMQSSSGQNIPVTQRGLHIKIDAYKNESKQLFTRIHTSYVTEKDILKTPMGGGVTTRTASMEITNGSFLPLICKSHLKADTQQIKSVDACFLPYTTNYKYENNVQTLTVTAAWILMLNYYSINRNAYLFFTENVELLEARNNYFDPIPVKLSGNISCITDPLINVTGFFEVASDTMIYRAYVWTPPNGKVHEMPLETYNPPTWIKVNDILDYSNYNK